MKTIFKTQIYKTLLIIGIFFLINNNVIKAQRSFGESFFTGGGLSFNFGSITLIDVSPIIGYRLTESIDIGVGATYKYYNYSDYYYYPMGNTTYSLKANIFGGSVFGRYHFTENFFAHAEFEYLEFNFDDYQIYSTSVNKQNKTVDVTSILIGGGYRQKMGANSYLTLMLLYNLNETQYSPYTNPIIKVGYTIGF